MNASQRHSLRWVYGILAGLVALVVLAACGTQTAVKSTIPTQPPASTSVPETPAATTPVSTYNLPTGTAITVTDSTTNAAWDVTLNSVKGYIQGQYMPAAPAGQHYIIADVTYQATRGPVNINELDWAAKDSSGTVAEAQILNSPGELNATTITAPNKVRGTITFAIPNGSSGTIVYSWPMSERASWVYTATEAS